MKELLKSDESEFNDGIFFVINKILSEDLEELNQWQPIDENTPKDKRVLLFYPTFGKVTGEWISWLGWKPDQSLISMNHQPTHWQGLPEDPK